MGPLARRTPFVGLTGAIAAGKSSALAALERLGASTLSSDAVVHELLETEPVRDLLVGRWGSEVAPDGRIDRAKVGAVVFERPDELAWLEGTLHPLVRKRIKAWQESLDPDATLAAVEVPLLFETGLDTAFDATICVVAPDEVRARRAGVRGTADLERRSARQLSQEEKSSRATYVVDNDGSLERLEARLAALLPTLEDHAGTPA